MNELHHHEMASIFPMMTGKELSVLAEDIKANGLQNPIILHDGKILDGRNRHEACRIAGIEPEFVEYSGDDPFRFIISLNLHRRHLDESQRAVVAARVANMTQGARTDLEPSANLRNVISQPEAARMFNVSERMIQTVKAIEREAPERIADIESGNMTATKVYTLIKKQEAQANAETIRNNHVEKPDGLYDVIIIDPPWPMEKIERDCRPNQHGFDYPTMTEEEIHYMDIPHAKDCHLWIWTTQRFLPSAFQMIHTRRFSYVCTFVWHKPGGFQPVGLPQYNAEFALYCRFGKPTFIDTKAFPVCFNAPRGAHSEKPQEFYDTVRRVTAGLRLDMFSRRQIAGFESWGNQANG